jgi:hypothetical protein
MTKTEPEPEFSKEELIAIVADLKARLSKILAQRPDLENPDVDQ